MKVICELIMLGIKSFVTNKYCFYFAVTSYIYDPLRIEAECPQWHVSVYYFYLFIYFNFFFNIINRVII